MVLRQVQLVRVVDDPRARPDHAQPPLGEHDVAVTGRVQAVDDHVAPASAHGHEDPGRATDGHLDPGHVGDPLGPRTGGVDHEVGGQLGLLAGHVVPGRDAGDRPRLAAEADHLGEAADVRAVPLRRREEPQREPHRVHGAVGHLDRTLHVSGQTRLAPQGLVRTQHGRRDPARLAGIDEPGQVVHVLVRDGDEQAVVLLERPRGDPAEDAVLGDALDRGLHVTDRVAATAVQQAVVASGGPRGDLAALQHGDAQAPQGQVVSDRTAGATAPDHDDVWHVRADRCWHGPHLPDEVRSPDQASPGGRRPEWVHRPW